MSLQLYSVNGHRRALGCLGHGGGVQGIAVTSTGASSREPWHITPKTHTIDNQRRSNYPQTHDMDYSTLLNSLPFRQETLMNLTTRIYTKRIVPLRSLTAQTRTGNQFPSRRRSSELML